MSPRVFFVHRQRTHHTHRIAGKSWNHAKVKANTGSDPITGDEDSSYAISDINPGEEFLDNYATYERIAWFESIAHEYGAFSCIDCADKYD